ncbi:hypothetical protein ACW5XF_06590 [Aeromonas lusitana]|uniref:Lipoprotein n=1 Tax=Aeromonas lusitana TaxID=931529 RepID=A0A2M8H8F1_9GAMM|nr:hypothetical protein [Aeromonas lusitana]PJC92791.1 hypothetical protein CUC44_13115 [Aeromonas lusitana]
MKKNIAAAMALAATLTGCSTPGERIAECQQENGYDWETCANMEQADQARWAAVAASMEQMRTTLAENQARQQQQALQNNMPRTTTCGESFGTLRCTTY